MSWSKILFIVTSFETKKPFYCHYFFGMNQKSFFIATLNFKKITIFLSLTQYEKKNLFVTLLSRYELSKPFLLSLYKSMYRYFVIFETLMLLSDSFIQLDC